MYFVLSPYILYLYLFVLAYFAASWRNKVDIYNNFLHTLTVVYGNVVLCLCCIWSHCENTMKQLQDAGRPTDHMANLDHYPQLRLHGLVLISQTFIGLLLGHDTDLIPCHSPKRTCSRRTCSARLWYLLVIEELQIQYLLKLTSSCVYNFYVSSACFLSRRSFFALFIPVSQCFSW